MGYKNPLKVEKKRDREPTYNMTAGQLHELSKKSVLDGMAAGVYTTNAMYSAAMLMVLHDTLGYGQIRLQRIHQRVQKLFGELMDRDVVYSDLLKTLKEECNVNLIIEKPDGVKQSALDLFEQLEAPQRIEMQFPVRGRANG